MSNPLTKYVAASALAGVIAFGGFTIAGAQDGSTTTTAPTEQGTTTQQEPSTEAPTRPDGERPDKAGCDQDKAGSAEGSSTESAPSTGGATTTESSNSTST